MRNKVEFFEKCIKSKDFKALVWFISEVCETEEDLLNVCKNSHGITLEMVGDLIKSATNYIEDSSYAISCAKRIGESNILTQETKKRLFEAIEKELDSTNVMGYKLSYFLEVIEKGILS